MPTDLLQSALTHTYRHGPNAGPSLEASMPCAIRPL
jgi:hypothetical protein